MSSSSLSRPLALLVAGAMFMELLDATVLATAAPGIARSLHVASTEIAVPISVYLVAVAAFIPVGGWCVDRFGARRVFATAVAIFTGASALCAWSPTFGFLVAMRVVQGIGGSLMVPVGRLVVLRDTARHEVIRAVAYLTWPALVAPIVAPFVGGVLTTHASWRWIFLINVPLGVVALAAYRIVPGDRTPVRPLDGTGLVLTAGFLASVSGLLGALAVPGAPLPVLVALALTATITGVATGRHLRRSPRPIVSLAPFRVATFRVAHAGGSLFRVLVNAAPFLLALTFQDAFGWTPERTGVIVAALFVGNLAVKPATTWLLRRLGFRLVLLGAAAGAALTVAGCGLLRASTPVLLVLVLLAVSGAFRSIGFTAYNTLAFADVDRSMLSDANTLTSVLQQLSMAAGPALGAIVLRAASASGLAVISAHALTFAVVATLAVPALVEAVRVPRDVGASLTGSPRPAAEGGVVSR